MGCAGEYQIGNDIKPLDPKTISSVVHFGRLKTSLTSQATGYSMVYNQLYPFEGLQNYTSGIIHHVRLSGTRFVSFLFLFYFRYVINNFEF